MTLNITNLNLQFHLIQKRNKTIFDSVNHKKTNSKQISQNNPSNMKISRSSAINHNCSSDQEKKQEKSYGEKIVGKNEIKSFIKRK